MNTTWAIGAIAAAATLTAAALTTQTLAATQPMDGPNAAPMAEPHGGRMAGYGAGHEGGRAMRGGWGGGVMRLSPEERKKVVADRFSQMDADHDGRVSFAEFHAYLERKKLEHQHEMFRRLAGGTESLTLDRLEQMGHAHGMEPGMGRDMGPGAHPGRGPMGRGGPAPSGE